jgi:hypothetical protein
MPSLIYFFVWSTAAGAQTVGGLTRGEVVVQRQSKHPQLSTWKIDHL